MAFRRAAQSAASCWASLSRQATAQQSGQTNTARVLQQLRFYAAEPAPAQSTGVKDGYVAQVRADLSSRSQQGSVLVQTEVMWHHWHR